MCDSPVYVNEIPVPCGRCPPCQSRRVNGWVFRMLEEQRVSVSAYFVTLTFDTDNLPFSDNGFPTLTKQHWQLFMKRLRKTQPEKLKYYMVGEYGTENKRPHYHAIIFNITDTTKIVEAWQYGGVHIGKVTTDSIAYCLKYINKHTFRKMHRRDDRLPEFSLMSKGLGRSYLDRPGVKRFHANLENQFVVKDAFKIALPRYYKKKMYNEEQLSEIRSLAEAKAVDKYRTDRSRFGSDQEYNAAIDSQKEGRLISHIQSLSRKTRKI